MPEESYERYIASFRTLIENHGAQNAIYALEQAFRLESEDPTHHERQNTYLAAVADEIEKLYYGIFTIMIPLMVL
jgi:hypothetical protein